MAPLLDVRGLRTSVTGRAGDVQVLDGVSLTLDRGEVLALVGESGSGKSMTCRSILQVLPSNVRITEGEVWCDGVDLTTLSPRQVRRFRGRYISMVLQDPSASLNPMARIGNQIRETIPPTWPDPPQERVQELLDLVEIPEGGRRLRQYPHQFSGGMRQRVASAIAMAPDPKVLILDEPTTALDVTVQARYLKMLQRLQRSTGVGIIFVSHDLGVVAQLCDRVAVMYAGRIVEEGPVAKVFRDPEHPYTRALLDSLPRLDDERDRLATIEGEPPDPTDVPPGCPFNPRCPHAMDRCRQEEPELRLLDGRGHRASCWLAEPEEEA